MLLINIAIEDHIQQVDLAKKKDIDQFNVKLFQHAYIHVYNPYINVPPCLTKQAQRDKHI